jgi:hypothetical protein
MLTGIVIDALDVAHMDRFWLGATRGRTGGLQLRFVPTAKLDPSQINDRRGGSRPVGPTPGPAPTAIKGISMKPTTPTGRPSSARPVSTPKRSSAGPVTKTGPVSRPHGVNVYAPAVEPTIRRLR